MNFVPGPGNDAESRCGFRFAKRGFKHTGSTHLASRRCRLKKIATSARRLLSRSNATPFVVTERISKNRWR